MQGQPDGDGAGSDGVSHPWEDRSALFLVLFLTALPKSISHTILVTYLTCTHEWVLNT